MFFQPRTLTSRTRRLHHIFTALLLNFLLIMAASRVVLADTIVREVDRLKKTSTLIIPFAFYSEADGLAVGLAAWHPGILAVWHPSSLAS